MGFIDTFQINKQKMNNKAVIPYNDELVPLVAHLQQLEMESSGKSVGLTNGDSASQIIFGDVGTNAQHSFFQLLHQSEMKVPVDFIAFAKPQINLSEYLAEDPEFDDSEIYGGFMANFLAQIDALALGKKNIGQPHRNFEGNRPSTVLIFRNCLAARQVGMLVALYEHRVVTKGFLTGINSFDQFGVELGKVMCQDLIRILKNPSAEELELRGKCTSYYVQNK